MHVSTQSEPLKRSKPLLPASLLTPAQNDVITAMYEGNRLVVAGMGFGKTVCAATAITELLDNAELNRVLIVTTPKIANTVWVQEFVQWEHTTHIQALAATGDEAQRLQAIKDKSNQVVIITFQQLDWMKQHNLFSLFDGLLIDETTKLKVSGGVGFRALRPALKHFKWRCGLTGTPVSENFESLFAQCLLIDLGKALGTRFDQFRAKYFMQLDRDGYKWGLLPGAGEAILEAVRPVLYIAPEYRDTLPEITYINHPLTMPEDVDCFYHAMLANGFNSLTEAANAAVLVGKLQQIASGFAYDDANTEQRISDYRIDACASLVASLTGAVLVAYWYQADLYALRRAIPDAEYVTPANLKKQVERFRAGKIRVLLVHPRSMGHGVQLEKSCHQLVWLAPQWSRDLWEQTNARIWRRGQTKPCQIHTLYAQNSIDEIIIDRVENKAVFDLLLKKHLGAR